MTVEWRCFLIIVIAQGIKNLSHLNAAICKPMRCLLMLNLSFLIFKKNQL